MKIYEVKYNIFPSDREIYKKLDCCPAQIEHCCVAYIETDDISKINNKLKDYYRKPINEIYYNLMITAIEMKKEKTILIKK